MARVNTQSYSSCTEAILIKEKLLILKIVIETLEEILKNPEIKLDESTPLIGLGGVLDSLGLVELCIRLEDKARTMGFEFDWTSEMALSKSQSLFRSVKELAHEMERQSKT
jgi:acyl carrier protein